MTRPSCILLPLFLVWVFLSTVDCQWIARFPDPPETCTPTIDANFRGCYKPTDTTQYISIVQEDCNHLTGVGIGVLDGIEADIAWSFSGNVQAADLANLTIRIEGSGAERTVTATQDASGLFISESGHHTLRLTGYETCP